MDQQITVAELFAGVGGFRLGLEGYSDNAKGWQLPAAGPYKTIWANQWEPGSDKRQFAARCYEDHFGKGSVVNEDIALVLDEYDAGRRAIPDVDMVVGGFPCQDYSVARPLSQADGIEGKKGVLWWSIYRFLRIQLALSHGKEIADREHREILDACRERDVERAGQLVFDHIMGACRSLLEHLPRTRSPEAP